MQYLQGFRENEIPYFFILMVGIPYHIIRFLKAKEEKKKTERKSNLLAGGLIYIADDFDETPDCFKEYM